MTTPRASNSFPCRNLALFPLIKVWGNPDIAWYRRNGVIGAAAAFAPMPAEPFSDTVTLRHKPQKPVTFTARSMPIVGTVDGAEHAGPPKQR